MSNLGYKYIIVLADIEYWNANYECLKDWCDEYLCDFRGMTVLVPNDEIMTIFALRWKQ